MNSCTEELKHIRQSLYDISDALAAGLSGHEQESNAKQLKTYLVRLDSLINPLLSPKPQDKPKFVIFNSTYPTPPTRDYPKRMAFDADILVVEDQRYHQIVAKEILTMLGCKTKFIDNSEDAIAAMLHHRYDLVLLDVDIHGTSGIDVARRYRQQEPHQPRVPLVTMTSMTPSTTRDNCRAAGIDAIAEKPYAIEKLLAILPLYLQPTVNA